jgi:hypothetical protein
MVKSTIVPVVTGLAAGIILTASFVAFPISSGNQFLTTRNGTNNLTDTTNGTTTLLSIPALFQLHLAPILLCMKPCRY